MTGVSGGSNIRFAHCQPSMQDTAEFIHGTDE